MPFDDKMLPDFQAIRKSTNWNYSLQNYLETRGSLELAVAFARFFWPEFVITKGCVIRAEGFDQTNFDAWWAKTNGDRRAVERALNQIHLRDLIPSDPTPLSDDVIDYLGTTVSEMWLSRLERLFPERRFEVRYFVSDASDDGGSLIACQH